jgi:hypothetical protein
MTAHTGFLPLAGKAHTALIQIRATCVLLALLVASCSASEESSPTAGVASNGFTVETPIQRGTTFVVNYQGALADGHGAYFQLFQTEGIVVATLRGDGNPQIPMSFSKGATDMHADLLKGATTRFTMGSSIAAGKYSLCLAGIDRQCTAIVVE